jgi:NAD(P)-dependent dehydrogenase (short-subunit alcohol dehydrogenase family)
MRILLVGATGTIGAPLATALEQRGHGVIGVGRSSGDHRADIADPGSIRALYDAVDRIDAVVCAAGRAAFGALPELGEEDFAITLANKLMGQVNLVRAGLGRVREGGSFTLTSGTLSQKPEAGTSAVSMAGAAVEAFARGAAIDLRGRYRVNVVSPGTVAEGRVERGLDPMPGIWAADLAARYVELVEGDVTGAVIIAEGPPR